MTERPAGQEAMTVERARQVVVERFGADAHFLYRLRDGQMVIMGIDTAFEFSGGHMAKALGNPAQVDETLLQLEKLKVGADQVAQLSSEHYKAFVTAGTKYLEQWRQQR